jgi:hypothetical protein
VATIAIRRFTKKLETQMSLAKEIKRLHNLLFVMKQYRFPILFGTILAKLFTAFYIWHSPRRRKLKREEIDHYMAILEKPPARAEGIQAFTRS